MKNHLIFKGRTLDIIEEPINLLLEEILEKT